MPDNERRSPALPSLSAAGEAFQISPPGWPVCRVCGCWEYDACWDHEDGACWWVEPDLCSHCAGKSGKD